MSLDLCTTASKNDTLNNVWDELLRKKTVIQNKKYENVNMCTCFTLVTLSSSWIM